MRKTPVVVSALLLALLLVACAPKVVPAPVPQAPAPAAAPAPAPVVKPAAPDKQAWEIEWEKVAEAAKKEGAAVLYTVVGGGQREIITAPFKSKYGVSIEAMTGSSSMIAAKLRAEQRAGIYYTSENAPQLAAGMNRKVGWQAASLGAAKWIRATKVRESTPQMPRLVGGEFHSVDDWVGGSTSYVLIKGSLDPLDEDSYYRS